MCYLPCLRSSKRLSSFCLLSCSFFLPQEKHVTWHAHSLGPGMRKHMEQSHSSGPIAEWQIKACCKSVRSWKCLLLQPSWLIHLMLYKWGTEAGRHIFPQLIQFVLVTPGSRPISTGFKSLYHFNSSFKTFLQSLESLKYLMWGHFPGRKEEHCLWSPHSFYGPYIFSILQNLASSSALLVNFTLASPRPVSLLLPPHLLSTYVLCSLFRNMVIDACA